MRPKLQATKQKEAFDGLCLANIPPPPTAPPPARSSPSSLLFVDNDEKTGTAKFPMVIVDSDDEETPTTRANGGVASEQQKKPHIPSKHSPFTPSSSSSSLLPIEKKERPSLPSPSPPSPSPSKTAAQFDFSNKVRSKILEEAASRGFQANGIDFLTSCAQVLSVSTDQLKKGLLNASGDLGKWQQPLQQSDPTFFARLCLNQQPSNKQHNKSYNKPARKRTAASLLVATTTQKPTKVPKLTPKPSKSPAVMAFTSSTSKSTKRPSSSTTTTTTTNTTASPTSSSSHSSSSISPKRKKRKTDSEQEKLSSESENDKITDLETADPFDEIGKPEPPPEWDEEHPALRFTVNLSEMDGQIISWTRLIRQQEKAKFEEEEDDDEEDEEEIEGEEGVVAGEDNGRENLEAKSDEAALDGDASNGYQKGSFEGFINSIESKYVKGGYHSDGSDEEVSDGSYYDTDDSFIDDSEVVKLKKSRPAVQGFFVSTPEIAFQSQPETEAESKPKKPPRPPRIVRQKVYLKDELPKHLNFAMQQVETKAKEIFSKDDLKDAEKAGIKTPKDLLQLMSSVENVMNIFDVNTEQRKRIYMKLAESLPYDVTSVKGRMKRKHTQRESQSLQELEKSVDYLQWRAKDALHSKNLALKRIQRKANSDIESFAAAKQAGEDSPNLVCPPNGSPKYHLRWEIFEDDVVQSVNFNTEHLSCSEKLRIAKGELASSASEFDEPKEKRIMLDKICQFWPEGIVSSEVIERAYERHAKRVEAKEAQKLLELQNAPKKSEDSKQRDDSSTPPSVPSIQSSSSSSSSKKIAKSKIPPKSPKSSKSVKHAKPTTGVKKHQQSLAGGDGTKTKPPKMGLGFKELPLDPWNDSWFGKVKIK